MAKQKYTFRDAATLVEQITAGLDGLGSTLKGKAEATMQELNALAGLQNRLNNGAGLAEMAEHIKQSGFKAIAIEDGMTLEQYTKKVDEAVHHAVDDARNSNFLATIKKNDAARLAKEAAEETKPGFAERLFGEDSTVTTMIRKHGENMEKRPLGQRFAISVGQVGLGMVGMSYGPHMIQQAMQGVKRQKEYAYDSNGNRQLAGIAIAPISGGEKAFKLVGGTAITAAGITALVLGFNNLGKTMQ